MSRSFGITMWEIFSFGEKPYNGMKHNDLKNFLKREERIAVSQIDIMGDIFWIQIWMWKKVPAPYLNLNFDKDSCMLYLYIILNLY